MSYFSIVKAESTTNLIANPSVEAATTGWTMLVGSAARSTLYSVSGLYSLAITPDANTGDGVYFPLALTSGTTYTFSVYVRGVAGVAYRILFVDTGLNVEGTPTTFTGDGAWHRYETTWTCDSTANYYLAITKNSSASTGVFYIDAAQCEAKAYATTYCDGSITAPIGFSSSGCYWNGIAHASTSSRYATSRAGGRVVDLEDTYGLSVGNIIGAGAAPVRNFYTPYTAIAGALHEHSHVDARVFTLLGTIVDATSLASLHSKRSALYSVLAPDTINDEPVLLRYSGSGKTLEISAYYDGGLEQGTLFLFNESVAIRFIATNTDWRNVVV